MKPVNRSHLQRARSCRELILVGYSSAQAGSAVKRAAGDERRAGAGHAVRAIHPPAVRGLVSRSSAIPESRFPAVGRRLPFWQTPRPSACPPLAGPSSPESRKPRATSRERRATGHEPARRRRFSPNPSSAFSAVSAVKERGVPWCCFFATSFPQRRMRIRACKKPSKTIKFGSKSIKKATFSVKKGSKKRAFRHAHLNILGCHPLWR